MTNKDKVYESYEKIVEWFDEHRSRELFEKPYLDMIISYLKPGSKILDLGCGMGQPIAEYFARLGYHITGVDGSSKMIELAKNRLPQERFLVGDMRTIELDEKFDAILAWHSFFHLPQNDQRLMFKVFQGFASEGAILAFTSGPSAGEVWGDNGGENLYHASLDPEEYKNLLANHHFSLITYKIEDQTCGGATVWVAKYKNDGDTL